MRLLLDTHCWLWWFANDRRLGPSARDLIGDGENEILFSAASSWEIAIKTSLGKLTLPEPPERYVPNRLTAGGMQGLAIEHIHALKVASLPPHHHDPFDRIIVAQAQVEGLSVITVNENVAAYEIDALWAGRGNSPW